MLAFCQDKTLKTANLDQTFKANFTKAYDRIHRDLRRPGRIQDST